MKKEITIERTFDAPLERVWQAWTDSHEVQKWWGPRGVTCPTCEWDARKGGELNIVMLAGAELGPMAGQEWPMKGVFEEVVPNAKLSFSNSAIDKDGNPILNGHTDVTFADEDGKTKVTIHTSAEGDADDVEQMLAGMEQGWNEQTDKLAELLIDAS